MCLLLAVFVGSSMAQRQAAAAPRELPAVANIWEQCGGRSCVKGDCRDTAWAETKCAEGLKCVRQSEYYWQCKAEANLYQQCGGTSCPHKGVCSDGAWGSCLGGNTCVRQSPYYWQCLEPTNPAAIAQQAAKEPAATQRNMRLSKAQLAHVPIPRHTVIHTKKAPASVSVAAIPQAQPARTEQVRPASVEQTHNSGPIRPVAAEHVRPASSAGAIRPAAVEQVRPASAGPIRPAEQVRPASHEEHKPEADSAVSTASLGRKDGPKEHPAAGERVGPASLPTRDHARREGPVENKEAPRASIAAHKQAEEQVKPRAAADAQVAAAAASKADPAAAFAASGPIRRNGLRKP